MNVSFFNGVSGMIAFQQGLDVLAHNMANANTDGYKETRATFQDLLYTEMDSNSEEENSVTGHGARVSSLDLLCHQGILRQTSNPLDLAIAGEGFFAVDVDGETQYTRAGALDISVEGKRAYLVNREGHYMLDSKGKHIRLEKDEDGEVYDLTALNEKVGVFLFSNPYGLQQTDGCRFRETVTSGEAYVLKSRDDKPYEVRSRMLEGSNLDMADEMTRLIVTQRAYQMNAKMVQTADGLEEIVNNLR